MNPDSSILQVSNLYKSFTQGGKTIAVLNGLELEVKVGERIGIVGLSGSGKSTLLHILGGLEHSDAGKILIHGQNIVQMDDLKVDHIRNNHLGFVYQFHHLLPDFSALENVSLPPLIRGQSKNDAKMLSREILHKVGLEHREDHLPGELSGGERQRVAIARSLVMKPKLILADEPTGNLDKVNSLLISNILFDLVNDEGSSLILVTHDTKIANKANKKVEINDGKISG